MPTLKVSLLEGRPLLDLRSYARRGPERREHLSPAEIAQISRTVRRVPEAVVKVLPRNSDSFISVARHIDYIGRKGELEMETDDGDRLSGKGIGRELLENWDLDLDKYRRQADLGAALGRRPSKLVHKLLFSMPPGTPPSGVLAAARNFLREEFALKHRYTLVLHTDEPHPHVHAVVKAVSERGERLHIRKATLREWRKNFARHLREQGIEANATERAVRGEIRTQQKDGIFRAGQRGASTHLRAKVEEVALEMRRGVRQVETGKSRLIATRRYVVRGWAGLSDMLISQELPDLAQEVRRFAKKMPTPRTDREQIAWELMERMRNLPTRERPSSR